MSIFQRRKNPEQLVKLLKEGLANPSAPAKLAKDGQGDQEAKPEKCAQLSSLLMSSNLVPKLIIELDKLPFEARKHFAQVFNNLMRRDLSGFVGYVERQPEILSALVAGYENPEIALNCGTMLRESIRHELIAAKLLYSSDLWKFFDSYVHLPNFEVGSDAFATFKDLLTRHKGLSAQFFTSHFDQVFTKYNSLLNSENYVTRRQSLKLLGEILLDRSNFDIMMKYIGEKENLKMMMNLLRDTSANIQFEAFHVFKVFVANPKKPDAISQILLNNREKLVAYLKNFQNSKGGNWPQVLRLTSGRECRTRASDDMIDVDEELSFCIEASVASVCPYRPVHLKPY
ncbi:Calcium-binding protein, partial [Globisporangium splendens]